MVSEVLVARLCIEDEGVRNQVFRGEIGFPAGLSELLEIPPLWETEDALDDRPKDRLRKDFLVGPLTLGRDVGREMRRAAKLLEGRSVLVDGTLESLQPGRGSGA